MAKQPAWTDKLKTMFKTDPNKIGSDGLTRLQRAVMNKELMKATRLIEAGARLNDKGQMKKPPLHIALDKGYDMLAVTLIKAGADVDLYDSDGNTPLHLAVQYNRESLVTVLLKADANPNQADHAGKTPLHYAGQVSSYAAESIIQQNANVNAQDKKGNTPLHLLLSKPSVMEALLNKGADPNLKNLQGQTPFSKMLTKENVAMHKVLVQSMLRKDADVNTRNPQNETLLHIAARLELNDMMRVALHYKADTGCKNNDGDTPLHILTRSLNTELMHSLLKQDKDLVHITNHSNRTPLGDLLNSVGTGLRRIDENIALVMKTLIDHGADPNTRDSQGRSFLHYAAAQDNAELIKYLVKAGADTDAADNTGVCPLHLAVKSKKVYALDTLLDCGANPDLKDNNGWTILDHLSRKGDRESPIVQRLIVGGGSYNKQLPKSPDQMQPVNNTQAQDSVKRRLPQKKQGPGSPF